MNAPATLFYVLALAFWDSSTTASASALLQGLDSHRHELQRTYIVTEARIHGIAPFDNMESWSVDCSSAYSDAKRVCIQTSLWILDDGNEKPAAGTEAQSKLLWDGHRLFRYYYRPDTERGSLQISDGPAEDAFRAWSNTASAPILGYFPGDFHHVVDLLRDDKVVTTVQANENIGGHECNVIEATGRFGKVRLWIDPKRDYNILQAQLEKSADDDWYGEKLSKKPNVPENFQAVIGPLGTLQKLGFRYEMRDVELEQHGSLWLPKSASYVRHTDFGEGRFADDEVCVTVRTMEIEPDWTRLGGFGPDFPDHTPVIKQGENIRLEWLDGKAVPVVDDSIVDKIDRDAAEHRNR